MIAMKVFVIMLLFFPALTISKADSEALEVLKHVRRVIGGSDIAEGEWPWLVHLKGKIPSDWLWGIPIAYTDSYCTASLINKRWVLTAAHCFGGPGDPSGIKTPKNWHATIGEIDRSHTAVDRFWGLISGHKIWYKHVSEIHIHPSYNTADNWKHDLALLKLESDLPISSDPNMGAVDLPTQDTTNWPRVGQSCVMKGWGCTKSGGNTPSIAKAVVMPVVGEARCSATFGPVSETRMCAGYYAKDKGICEGDSGGALVCMYNGKWYQAGIASFGSANQSGQYPGVFTRVSHYRDWIIRTVGRLGN